MSADVVVLAVVMPLLKKLPLIEAHLLAQWWIYGKSGEWFGTRNRYECWTSRTVWAERVGTTWDNTSHVMRRSVRRPESPHPGNPTDIITWHSKLRACGPGILRLQPSYDHSVVMLLQVSNYTSVAMSVVSPRQWVKKRALVLWMPLIWIYSTCSRILKKTNKKKTDATLTPRLAHHLLNLWSFLCLFLQGDSFSDLVIFLVTLWQNWWSGRAVFLHLPP